MTGSGDRAFCVVADRKELARTGDHHKRPGGFVGITPRMDLYKPVMLQSLGQPDLTSSMSCRYETIEQCLSARTRGNAHVHSRNAVRWSGQVGRH